MTTVTETILSRMMSDSAFADALFAEATPLEAHGIQAIGVGVSRRGGLRERKHVPGNGCAATNK